MKGKLRDLSLADLIQQNCLDQKTAKLIVRHQRKQAEFYFKAGNLVHAQLDKQEGEAVVFHALSWEDGEFELQSGKEAPRISIQRSWSGLLLEAARQIDEASSADPATSSAPSSPEESPSASQVLQEIGEQTDGYLACAVIALDGNIVAGHSAGKIIPAVIAPLMTQLLKFVNSAVDKLNAGKVEDDVVTTQEAYILLRYLPENNFYLIIVAERAKASLGNLRLVARTYANKIHLEQKQTARCVHLAVCPLYKRKFPVREEIYSLLVKRYCQAEFQSCEVFALIEDALASGVPVDFYTREIQSMVAGD